MKRYGNLQKEYVSLQEKYKEVFAQKEELAYALTGSQSEAEHIREQEAQIRALHENVRHLKHDMKNHLMVIASFLNSGDIEAAKVYTSEILDKLNRVHSYIESGNSLLNHILNEKLESARAEGIGVKAEIENLSFERMQSLDFAALLQRPKLLLLDEPASGLDETAKQAFQNLLAERKKETGMTVLLTSHDMVEISRLCDRIAFLHEGKLLFHGEEEALQRRFLPQETIRLKVLGGMPDLEDLPLEKYEFDGEVLQLGYRADVIAAAEILQFLLRKCNVTEVCICKPKLEDIVARIVKESGNERIYRGEKCQ